MTEPDMFLCAEDRETLANIRARLAEGPDVLDEADHRPRHLPDGSHLARHGCGRWHRGDRPCRRGSHPIGGTLADWASFRELTFCDCPC